MPAIFSRRTAKYYPTDDLMFLVGHTYTKGNNAIRAGVEYIPEQFRGGATVASLFVDGAYGWNKSSTIMGGVKIYFGNSDKSLKRRHREDDPEASNRIDVNQRMQEITRSSNYMISKMNEVHESIIRNVSCSAP